MTRKAPQKHTKSSTKKMADSSAKLRNRLTPIPSSIDTIRGYPQKLIIYKTDASKYFWVRLYFNGRYHTKSTKAESVVAAKSFAVSFYESVLVNAKVTHKSDKSKAFATMGARFFESVEQSTKATVFRTDFSRYKSDLLPLFGEQEIDTITNAQISGLQNRLLERNLSTATIKHFMVVLRKIMKFAVSNDLMSNIPVFPKVGGRLKTFQKRDYLTLDEYKAVVAKAEKLAEDKVEVRGVKITLEMKYLIQFMVNTFIRPSDLRVIKHKHVKVQEEGKDKWITLTHPSTKTNDDEVQAMPSTVPIYQKLVEFKKQEKMKLGLDEYVFFPEYDNRDTAMAVMARLLKRIVLETDIEAKTGKNITMYGLRHTAIMFRLTIGRVDALALAKNARTSQQMIDKFYASHLKTSQVRKQLHAFPNEQAPKTEEEKKATAKKTASKKTATKKKEAKNIPTKKTAPKKVLAKKKATSDEVSKVAVKSRKAEVS
jgi:integrase